MLKYLNHHLTKQMNELYASTVIFAFGESMLFLFIPIYFYKTGFSLNQILLFFAFHYAAYAILMLFTGKLIAKIGYEKSIGWSMPLYALYLIMIFNVPAANYLFYLSAAVWALYKAMYWPAFHADFTKCGTVEARGEEIGWLKIMIGIVSILGPALGGFILNYFEFKIVFIVAIALAFVSLIPLFISREKYEPEEFSAKHIVLKFFKPKYRQDVVASVGYGEDVIAQTIWPIFLFSFFADYKTIGLLTTMVLFATFVIILIVGKLANKSARAGLVKTTSGIVSLSWLAKIFAFHWVTIFLSDALYNTSKKSLDVSVSAIVYSRPKENKLLDYLIFKEIALSLGKVIAVLFALAILFLTGQIIYTFALAAILTIFYFSWKDKILEQ